MPTTAPVWRICDSRRRSKSCGERVHEDQHGDADDEADRPRPLDQAEEPVDQEGGEPDIDERR